MEKSAKIKAGTNALLICLLVLGIAAEVNVLSRYAFGRWDLTEFKIHVLSGSTKKLLKELDDTVEVKVYVSKNLPDFVELVNQSEEERKIKGKRFDYRFKIRGIRQALFDKLNEFKSYAGRKLKVTFVSKDIEKAAKDQGIRLLKNADGTDTSSAKLAAKEVAIGAVFYYKDKKEVWRQAIDRRVFEEEIVKILRRLTHRGSKKYIGFVSGHGEYAPFDAKLSLPSGRLLQLISQRSPYAQMYIQRLQMFKRQIDGYNKGQRKQLEDEGFFLKIVDASKPVPADVKLLVVLNPQKKLSEKELFHIEQFMLHNHTVIFMASRYLATMRPQVRTIKEAQEMSLRRSQLGLDDFFKHYGLKIEKNLILDYKNRNQYPFQVFEGRQLLTKYYDYPFFPMIPKLETGNILTRNFADLTLPFANQITILRKGPHKVSEILQTAPTSFAWRYNTTTAPHWEFLKKVHMQMKGFVPSNLAYSWEKDFFMLMPFRFDGETAKVPPSMVRDQKRRTVGVVLEGTFTSYFKGKKLPVAKAKLKEQGKGRMVLIASSLGIVGVSGDLVFAHIKPSMFFGQRGMMGGYQALQTSVVKIQEIVGLFRATLTMRERNRAFLYNLLDWGLGQASDVRNKKYVFRSLRAVSDGEKSLIKLASLAGVPILFILFGVLRYYLRRSRRESLVLGPEGQSSDAAPPTNA